MPLNRMAALVQSCSMNEQKQKQPTTNLLAQHADCWITNADLYGCMAYNACKGEVIKPATPSACTAAKVHKLPQQTAEYQAGCVGRTFAPHAI
jgi:hypothetical protein